LARCHPPTHRARFFGAMPPQHFIPLPIARRIFWLYITKDCRLPLILLIWHALKSLCVTKNAFLMEHLAKQTVINIDSDLKTLIINVFMNQMSFSWRK
jgi:hypothetical protein